MIRLFNDRIAAGRTLSRRLAAYSGRPDVVVLALPRGGVPVASEVARALGAPLELLLVRKLGVPHTQVVVGAIAGGGSLHVDPLLMAEHGVSKQQLDEIVASESLELIRRHAMYCGNRPLVPLEGRTVIVVDDGVATGGTMRAALKALRSAKPAWIVVAVPVAPPEAQDLIGTAADEFVCVECPPDFESVGRYYRDFGRTSDEEIRSLMARAPPDDAN